MTEILALLALCVLAQPQASPNSCPRESLSHAESVYAPLPRIRDLTPSCGRIGPPTLELVIGTNGSVSKGRFLKRSGCKPADTRLYACLQYWRYRPATCRGQPIAERITVTIHWHPEERDGEDPCQAERAGVGEEAP